MHRRRDDHDAEPLRPGTAPAAVAAAAAGRRRRVSVAGREDAAAASHRRRSRSRKAPRSRSPSPGGRAAHRGGTELSEYDEMMVSPSPLIACACAAPASVDSRQC